jgi:hypothetical protein
LADFNRRKPARAAAFDIALKLEQSAGKIDFNLTLEKEGNSPALKLFKRLNQDDKDHTPRIQDYMRKKASGNPDLMSEVLHHATLWSELAVKRPCRWF